MVERTKKIVVALADIGNFFDAVFADGKVNWSDTTHLAKLTSLIPAVTSSVGDFDALKDELKNLDETGRAELVSAFKAEFDLAEEDVEGVVEEAIELLSHAGDVVKKIIDFSKAIKK